MAIILGIGACSYSSDEERFDVAAVAVRHFVPRVEALCGEHLSKIYLTVFGEKPNKRLLNRLHDLPIHGNKEPAPDWRNERGAVIITISKLARQGVGRYDVEGSMRSSRSSWGSNIILLRKGGAWQVKGEAGHGLSGCIQEFKQLPGPEGN